MLIYSHFNTRMLKHIVLYDIVLSSQISDVRSSHLGKGINNMTAIHVILLSLYI